MTATPSTPQYPRLFVLWASLFGLLAGLSALAIEESFAFLSYGYFLPVEGRHLWPYLTSGLLMVGFIWGLSYWRRRELNLPQFFCLALLGIFALPLIERLHHFFSIRVANSVMAIILAIAMGIMALIIVWILLYRLSHRGNAASLVLAALLGGGLIANRALVTSILSREALLIDAMLFLSALACAWSLRFSWIKKIAIWLLAAGALAFVFHREPINRHQADSQTQFASKRKWPNVILVVVDTLRYDIFQTVVENSVEGQAFKQWFEDAVWFDRASAVAPWTVPSMGSVLTGYHPEEHGFRLDIGHKSRSFMALPESVPTLGERFSDIGYQTLAVTTNPLLNTQTGLARGFQTYELLVGVSDKLPLLTVFFRLNLIPKDFYQDARKVRLKLAEKLEGIRKSSPLFLWLHLVDPHLPLHKHPHLTPYPYPESFSKRQRLYLDETRWTLEQLSETFSLLKSHGLWEKSLVVFVSDHGEMFPEDQHDLGTYTVRGEVRQQLRYGHGHSLHRELIHVPLVIRPPGGLPGGRRSQQIVSQPDIYETIADLLGFPRLKRGRASLLPVLQPKPPQRYPRRWVAPFGHIQKGIEQVGIRSGSFKLIEFPQGERPTEFYDLRSDPYELESLTERMPTRVENFRKYLEEEKARMKAPKGERKAVPIDKATEERLRALGYL